MNPRNLEHLLSINDPVLFIETCYKELLGRGIAPLDLKNLVMLFNQGMNKHALIYCILKSNEFNNQFAIDNLPHLRKQYLKYKLLNLLFKIFHFKSSACLKPAPEILIQANEQNLSNSNTETYIENQALSLCNIAQLEALIKSHALESTVITSPTKIYSLLMQTCENSFSQISKSLIFSMPSLPLSEGEIAIIWDKNWDKLTEGKHNSKCFRSPDSTGRIILYNNSSNYQKISIHLQISSIENNSELLFKINNVQKKCILSPKPATLNFSLYLKPFYNEIPFTYIGCGVHSESRETNFLKFFLENITCSSNSITYLDTSVIGEGFFPYLLNDSYIRSKLHKNGFFEISAIKLLKSYQILPLDTTRYDYLSDSFNGSGYYCIQKGACPSEISEKPGVTLYTAKRTGTFSRK